MEQNQQAVPEESVHTETEGGQPSVNSLRPTESEPLDLSAYEGKRVKLENIEIIEVPTSYSDTGKQKVLRVESEAVTTVKDRTGAEKPVRASELFNLTEDNGRIGWSKNEKAKLQRFLNKVKVDHPSQLQGKEAIIRLREKTNSDDSKTTFLGFVI